MICQNCGAQNLDGINFCRYCGSKLNSTPHRFCYACGRMLSEGVKFCPGCGAKANNDSEDILNTTGQSDSSKNDVYSYVQSPNNDTEWHEYVEEQPQQQKNVKNETGYFKAVPFEIPNIKGFGKDTNNEFGTNVNTRIFTTNTVKNPKKGSKNKLALIALAGVLVLCFIIVGISASIERKNSGDKSGEKPTEKTEAVVLAPTKAPEITEETVKENTEAEKEPETLYYSTNTKDTVKNGNTGVYAYKNINGTYDTYYIIDFDNGYVYFFSDGNEETSCDRLKIESGNLNDVLIITYREDSNSFSYGLHFKRKNQPDRLIIQDETGWKFEYRVTDLQNALSVRDTKTIIEWP